MGELKSFELTEIFFAVNDPLPLDDGAPSHHCNGAVTLLHSRVPLRDPYTLRSPNPTSRPTPVRVALTVAEFKIEDRNTVNDLTFPGSREKKRIG